MNGFEKARALATLLVFFAFNAEANTLCARSMEKLAIINSIEANLKTPEGAAKEEVESLASFKEALRRLTLGEELSLGLLQSLRTGLQKHYWHVAALPALPEYTIIKTLAALGDPKATPLAMPTVEARAKALQAARAFASLGRIALPTESEARLRDKKVALLNSLDGILNQGPFDTMEVKETIEAFTKELRALVMADEVSLATLQGIRDGLSKAHWKREALFDLPGYRIIRAYAEYQGIKIELPRSGPRLELLGEAISTAKGLGDVLVPSPDGKWVLEGGTRGAVLRSLQGDETVNLEAVPPHVVDAIFLSNKRVAITFVDSVGFGVWNTETGELVGNVLHQVQTGSGSATQYVTASAIAASPDGKYILVGAEEGRYVFAYDALEYRLIGTRNVRDSGISHLAFTPDGKQILGMIGDGIRAKLFDVKTGNALRTFEVTNGISAAAVSTHEETIVTASISGDVAVWSRQTGKRLRLFETGLLAPEVSPDGRWVADFRALEGKKKWRLEVWDVMTGKIAHQFDLGDGQAAKLTFSADSQAVAVSMANLEKTQMSYRLFAIKGE